MCGHDVSGWACGETGWGGGGGQKRDDESSNKERSELEQSIKNGVAMYTPSWSQRGEAFAAAWQRKLAEATVDSWQLSPLLFSATNYHGTAVTLVFDAVHVSLCTYTHVPHTG